MFTVVYSTLAGRVQYIVYSFLHSFLLNEGFPPPYMFLTPTLPIFQLLNSVFMFFVPLRIYFLNISYKTRWASRNSVSVKCPKWETNKNVRNILYTHRTQTIISITQTLIADLSFLLSFRSKLGIRWHFDAGIWEVVEHGLNAFWG